MDGFVSIKARDAGGYGRPTAVNQRTITWLHITDADTRGSRQLGPRHGHSAHRLEHVLGREHGVGHEYQHQGHHDISNVDEPRPIHGQIHIDLFEVERRALTERATNQRRRSRRFAAKH